MNITTTGIKGKPEVIDPVVGLEVNLNSLFGQLAMVIAGCGSKTLRKVICRHQSEVFFELTEVVQYYAPILTQILDRWQRLCEELRLRSSASSPGCPPNELVSIEQQVQELSEGMMRRISEIKNYEIFFAKPADPIGFFKESYGGEAFEGAVSYLFALRRFCRHPSKI